MDKCKTMIQEIQSLIDSNRFMVSFSTNGNVFPIISGFFNNAENHKLSNDKRYDQNQQSSKIIHSKTL